MKLVLLGGPGAGKGTQANRLSKSLKIPVVCTGDILRDAIASQTELGMKAQSYVEKGALVPDSTMIEFMRQRLQQPDILKGWVLDGYPRTAFQAEELYFLLDDLAQKLDWAIYLQVSEAVMMKRSLNRGLSDDEVQIIHRRSEAFKSQTIPILEYYDRRQKLLTINAEDSPEQVEAEILQRLIQ